MKESDINNMKDVYIREYLRRLIAFLDTLDEDDFFGTEGWRHMMGDDE